MNEPRGIVYGNVEVTDEELQPSATRARMSVMLPLPLLHTLDDMAKAEGVSLDDLVARLLKDSLPQP